MDNIEFDMKLFELSSSKPTINGAKNSFLNYIRQVLLDNKILFIENNKYILNLEKEKEFYDSDNIEILIALREIYEHSDFKIYIKKPTVIEGKIMEYCVLAETAIARERATFYCDMVNKLCTQLADDGDFYASAYLLREFKGENTFEFAKQYADVAAKGGIVQCYYSIATDAPTYEETIELYKKVVDETGYIPAIYELQAIFYKLQNYEESIKYGEILEKGAVYNLEDKFKLDSLFMLASSYEIENIYPEKVLEIMEYCAENGHEEALEFLVVKGNIESEFQKVLELLKKADSIDIYIRNKDECRPDQSKLKQQENLRVTARNITKFIAKKIEKDYKLEEL